MILEGSRELLASGTVRHAFVEVSVEPLYEGGSSYLEIARYLQDFGLYLRELVFNEMGWTDAIFERVYWPRLLPCSDVSGGKNVAPLALLEFSSAIILAPPRCFSGARTGGFSFHTALEDAPWVKMVFPESLTGAMVVVFNRCDDCPQRAYPLNVYASRDGCEWELVHENQDPFGGVDWPGPLRIGVHTEFSVLLFKLRGRDYLHFDQIEVYPS